MTPAHVLFLATLVLATPTPEAAAVTTDPVSWEACPSGYPDPLRCATITVPLDYSGQDSETLDLTMLKLPARNKTSRQGSILWQFGGPGEVTSNYLIKAAKKEILQFGDVQATFDIISLDPRGVGMNHPVKCDPDFNQRKISYFPKSEEEYNSTLAQLGAMGQSCLERTGRVMDYMDTHTQARDLEIARVAIGEGPLNYYGVSWGSMLGFDYAAMHPDSVGMMVLDGIVDHSGDSIALTASESHSMSLTVRRMLNWMRTNDSSALQDRDTIKIWRELIERADETPVPAPECIQSGLCFPNVSGSDLRTGIYEALSHPSALWAEASRNIAQAHDNNNATGFSYPISDSETGVLNSQFAITCHDWHFEDDWEAFKLVQYMSGAASLDPVGPVAGRIWALACPRWPAKVTNPPRYQRIRNSASKMPILIVHALYDPATGYDQAVRLNEKIENSVLLTRYGEGHGSLEYVEGAQAIMDYFVNGTVPDATALVDEPMNPEARTDFEILGWN